MYFVNLNNVDGPIADCGGRRLLSVATPDVFRQVGVAFAPQKAAIAGAMPF